MILTKGVVLGTSPGTNANPGILYVRGSGKLISEGSPVLRNRLVRYHTVQEQSVTNAVNNGAFVYVGLASIWWTSVEVTHETWFS